MKPTIFMNEGDWAIAFLYRSHMYDRFIGFQFGQLYIGIDF